MKNILSKIKETLKKNIKFIILLIISILIILSICFIFVEIDKIKNNQDKANNEIRLESYEEEKIEADYIYVDVKGFVNNPGVYKIEKGSRVTDVIKLSGGLKKEANTRFINLSKILNDSDTIVIYSNKEIEEAKKQDVIVVETPCVCEEIKNDACFTEKEESSSKIININTATKDQLMTLNGIGEAKATAIIEYRTINGKFKDINDLIQVDGISETLFDKIKETITV